LIFPSPEEVRGLKLTSPSTVRELLQEHGLRLKKSLGQHFLCDENILNKLITAAEISSEDLVIEPGAGLGTLTLALAAHAGKVIAVEVDSKLIPLLQDSLTESGAANVEVLHQNFLALDLVELIETAGMTKAKVAGNLPYKITSPILERLMTARTRLASAILMVQYELAERLVALPGPRASALGVQLQAIAELKLLSKVPRTVFYPPPGVDSALIKLLFLKKPRIEADEEVFSRVVRAAFNLRRKTIKQALVRSPFLRLQEEVALAILHEAGIEQQRRGESFSIEDFDRLAQALQDSQLRSGSGVGQ
jgi:16S rRNA (adenine1518-N6/adenine1519-N6)-dimethyltransferase